MYVWNFFFLPKHVKVVTMQVFLKLPQLVINCCFMTSIVVTGEQVSLSSCCELQPSSCLSQQKSCMHHGTREGVSTLERLQKHLPRFPQTTELFSSSSVFFFLAVFETCSVFCQPPPPLPSSPNGFPPSLWSWPARIITFLIFSSEAILTHPGRHVNPQEGQEAISPENSYNLQESSPFTGTAAALLCARIQPWR